MKIIHKNLKQGEIKVKVENIDDLWYLSNVIENTDLIKGITYRKIKTSQDSERSSSTVRKKVFLSIKTEQIEFHETSNVLRVSGKIISGPDDIGLGSYHTFNIEEDTIIKAMRTIWERMKIIIEPSAAVAVAAVFENKKKFYGKRVGIILTGGNVDLETLPWTKNTP